MDYFLFNFSGVQFHYTMSHQDKLYGQAYASPAHPALNDSRHFKFFHVFTPIKKRSQKNSNYA